jgi:hypothetical protein
MKMGLALPVRKWALPPARMGRQDLAAMALAASLSAWPATETQMAASISRIMKKITGFIFPPIE